VTSRSSMRSRAKTNGRADRLLEKSRRRMTADVDCVNRRKKFLKSRRMRSLIPSSLIFSSRVLSGSSCLINGGLSVLVGSADFFL
jgi:hypothetical protein